MFAKAKYDSQSRLEPIDKGLNSATLLQAKLNQKSIIVRKVRRSESDFD